MQKKLMTKVFENPHGHKFLITFVIQAFKNVLDKFLGVNIASPTTNI